MAEGLTDFRSSVPRDYIESLPDVTWTSIESDQHVFRLMAAIDRFRFVDEDQFDFEDPSELPENDTMREIVELLTSPENSDFVTGYYERECQGEINPFAERVWSYIRARTQRAEQDAGDQAPAAVE